MMMMIVTPLIPMSWNSDKDEHEDEHEDEDKEEPYTIVDLGGGSNKNKKNPFCCNVVVLLYNQ